MKRLSIALVALLAAGARRPRAQEAPSPISAIGEEAGAGIRWTLGLGAVAFPDYQGSSDYTAAPLWNVRAQNLYHPDTYAQLFGPIFTSNLIPDSRLPARADGAVHPQARQRATTTRSTT